MRETFSAGEASHITGVSYSTLNHWARSRFLVPGAVDAKGSGNERRYTFKDLIALRAAKQLRSAGVSTQSLRKVVKVLRKKDVGDPLSELRLVVRGREVYVVHGAGELTAVLMREGQAAFSFVLDLTETVTTIRSGAASIKAA